jgi:O-antigen ligase
MAENAQPHPLHSVPHSASGELLGGGKAKLALIIAAAVAAALFVCVHWSIALVGAVAILALSAAESEPFLLLVIFLTPISWILNGDVLLRNVPVTLHVLVAIGFFLGRLWRGRLDAKRLLSPSLTKASFLFVGTTVASVTFGGIPWTHGSAGSLYEVASYLGFFLVILAWADSQQRIRKILGAVFFSTIVTASFAILQEIIGGYTPLWLYLNPLDEGIPQWESRATSFLAYSNSLAGYLNLVLPFALACHAFGKGRWKKLGSWTVGLGFVGLLCTQSLGGLVSFGFVVILAILCFIGDFKKRLFLLVCICTLAIGFYLAKETLNPSHQGEGFGYDVVLRLLLWGAAWDLFRHSSIFGVGWGNFVTLYNSYITFSWVPSGTLEVHNLYLQLLAETGILGFTSFFSLIYLASREARRQWGEARDDLSRVLSFGVLGAILTVLVHGFVDFLFHVSPQFGTLFWMFLALLLANASRIAPKNRLAPCPPYYRPVGKVALRV